MVWPLVLVPEYRVRQKQYISSRSMSGMDALVYLWKEQTNNELALIGCQGQLRLRGLRGFEMSSCEILHSQSLVPYEIFKASPLIASQCERPLESFFPLWLLRSHTRSPRPMQRMVGRRQVQTPWLGLKTPRIRVTLPLS